MDWGILSDFIKNTYPYDVLGNFVWFHKEYLSTWFLVGIFVVQFMFTGHFGPFEEYGSGHNACSSICRSICLVWQNL